MNSVLESAIEKIKSWEGFGQFSDFYLNKEKKLTLSGASGSGARFFAVALREKLAKEKKIIYVLPNEYSARVAYGDFENFYPEQCVLLEPSEYMFYNAVASNKDLDYRRLEALKRLADGDFSVLVLSVKALAQFVPSKDKFDLCKFKLSVGDAAEPQHICDQLVKMGYIRVQKVDGQRQFALRGDILDIFPTSSENPYRVEFYGDEVDTIRSFDIETQRSDENLDCFEILGESELLLGVNGVELSEKITAEGIKKTEKLANENLSHDILAQFNSDAASAASTLNFPGRDRYVSLIIGREHNVMQFSDDWICFCEDYCKILNNLDTVNEEHAELCGTLIHSMAIPDGLCTLYMNNGEMEALLSKNRAIDLKEVASAESFNFDGIPYIEDDSATFFVRQKLLLGAQGNTQLIDDMLKRWRTNQYDVFFGGANKEKSDRMKKFIFEKEISLKLNMFTGGLKQGFECESLGLAMVCENTFFTVSSGKQAKKSKRKDAINTFADITPGDYVVHDVHGIGVFEGVVSREFEGVVKDYVLIRYADNGALYLPSYQLGTLHKYIGAENVIPKVSTLGGKDWQKLKQKAKDQLRDYVQELVVLYAKRSSMKGFAFDPDTPWQTEFEQDFSYEPTEDQLLCVREIKKDMEASKPMERLLCGDVGFGKTEVAFRAAFKAVLGGKQVAILCPTTVLARQHYYTAITRFAKFPVTIDYLCRLRTPKESAKVLEEVNNGKVDILIGTHSILQKKADFKNLGLLIIDEEQRFGVQQKDKLKAKWPGVDILTLSATPIPRTLNMSLSKIRDISLLTEPPKSRNPVQTYVLPMNRDIVRNAIYREMARKGQIFYLFNSVSEIMEKQHWLKELVPEARILVGHGQMSERELENVMDSFINGEADILLCTTIIESGLDIPRANTIIVENGHRLGLAQLYQIRGRVGRSDVKAYAYITYPENMVLKENAEKRLETIKEFTEFGSGFKVALRDLQIRGAGSVFGERQSGEVFSSIGYDMYCRMLNNMIEETMGNEVKEEVIVNVDFMVNCNIPDTYITDTASRLEIYRKIAEIETETDLRDVVDELIDRFPGDVPENVLNLMEISKIRHLASLCGIKAVNQSKLKVELLVGDTKLFDECLMKAAPKLRKDYFRRFNVMESDDRLYGTYLLPDNNILYHQKELLKDVEKFLECFVNAQ